MERFRPDSPWFAFSLKWVIVITFIGAIATMLLGMLIRYVVVAAQPQPLWVVTNCAATEPYITEKGTAFVVECGGDRRFAYSLSDATPEFSRMILPGYTATCSERPNVFTAVSKTESSCVINPKPEAVNDPSAAS